MEEEWRDSVSGVRCQYQVSSRGRVRRSLLKGGHKLVNGTNNGRGYIMLAYGPKGAQKRTFVHVLVAEAFLGPKPDGMVVDHKDRNRSNNDISNLRYITQAENNRNSNHCVEHIPELEGMDQDERNRVLEWIAHRRDGHNRGEKRTKLNVKYEPIFGKYI